MRYDLPSKEEMKRIKEWERVEYEFTKEVDFFERRYYRGVPYTLTKHKDGLWIGNVEYDENYFRQGAIGFCCLGVESKESADKECVIFIDHEGYFMD